jgi:acyl-CoA dehydrogenase
VPRAIWQAAGALGTLCAWVPESYGGPGGDILFDLVVTEELGRVGATGPGFSLHSLIVAPYIAHFGTEVVKQRILPGMVSGERIGAIAMTEPSTGSDLANIRTRAVREAEGWCLNGQKTFITNGVNADIVVTACVTDPSHGAKGISLFVVECTAPGFSRGEPLRKIGQHAQDTAQLFFDNVYLPPENLLGEVNQGFMYMMNELAQERLLVSVQCQSRAEAVFEQTLAYVKERKAFGKPILAFQNSRFVLAGLKSELMAGRAFCDQLVRMHLDRRLGAVEAAAGKLWHSELLGRVTDSCLQLHGGYGYMADYPVARAYLDARVERIYAGTSEIMKEVVGRSLDEPT